jgi:hypothetical protein
MAFSLSVNELGELHLFLFFCKMKRDIFVDREVGTANITYPKGGVSCSKDSFVVNQTLVFQIKFCGKCPALRVAAKR